MTDTARPVSDVMHRIWISAILFGALAAILGVAMLVWPGPSIVVAAALFGAYLVMSGVAMVILAFALPAASGASRFLNFLSGAVLVILGIWRFGTSVRGMRSCCWPSGLRSGSSSAVCPRWHWRSAIRGFPGRGWSIFFGVISVLAGVVVLAYPFDSIVTLALVVGIWLIILGVMEVISAFGMRSDVKKIDNIADTAAGRLSPEDPVGSRDHRPPGAAGGRSLDEGPRARGR